MAKGIYRSVQCHRMSKVRSWPALPVCGQALQRSWVLLTVLGLQDRPQFVQVERGSNLASEAPSVIDKILHQQ